MFARSIFYAAWHAAIIGSLKKTLNTDKGSAIGAEPT